MFPTSILFNQFFVADVCLCVCVSVCVCVCMYACMYLSLEVLIGFPPGPRQFFGAFVGLYVLSCARAPKLNQQICMFVLTPLSVFHASQGLLHHGASSLFKIVRSDTGIPELFREVIKTLQL